MFFLAYDYHDRDSVADGCGSFCPGRRARWWWRSPGRRRTLDVEPVDELQSVDEPQRAFEIVGVHAPVGFPAPERQAESWRGST